MTKFFNTIAKSVLESTNMMKSIGGNTEKRIKASFRCPPEFRQQFVNSHCLLPISVGQLPHAVQSPQEGAKFKATVELVNEKKFRKCTILVDDRIQVPTYQIIYREKNESELLNLTLAIGNEWINNHSLYYQSLKMPYEIKRWQDVIDDPDFDYGRQEVENRYRKDPLYQKAFHDNIEEFLGRLKIRGVQFDHVYGFQKCLEYLINENAGMGFVWPKWKAQFEIYPSGRNASMTATYKTFIEQKYPATLLPISLRFVKRVAETENETDLHPATLAL